jgi:outer membrane protein assembly factor BamB
MRTVCTGLTLLALCCAAAFSADNWPRFRGPNGTGVSADKDIPVEWTPANTLWKTPIPGVGHSSPIVWGDSVFVQSAGTDGATRMLLCLNLADGKVRWTKTVSAAKGKTHKFNSQASATPATDGERVYAITWAGDKLLMSAYDFKGNEVWTSEVGRAFTGEHGAGHSPVVADGKVFVNNDQTGGSEVVALDAKTGKKLWKTPRAVERTCYSTPMLREGRGGAELVVASTAGLTGYNPDDGKVIWEQRWSFRGKPLRTVGSPATVGDVVFVSSGDGSGERTAMAVKPAGDKAEMLWDTTNRIVPYVPTAVSRGEHLYYVNDQCTAVCQEAKTGKVVWENRLPGGKQCFASPVLIDGKVYAVSDAGDVFVIEAKPEYKLLAKNPLREGVMATPAVSQGRMLVRGEKTLFCVGKAK